IDCKHTEIPLRLMTVWLDSNMCITIDLLICIIIDNQNVKAVSFPCNTTQSNSEITQIRQQFCQNGSFALIETIINLCRKTLNLEIERDLPSSFNFFAGFLLVNSFFFYLNGFK
ncbi:hypothetical protein FRX31_025875, partial [Thalictrum thalictroides]